MRAAGATWAVLYTYSNHFGGERGPSGRDREGAGFSANWILVGLRRSMSRRTQPVEFSCYVHISQATYKDICTQFNSVCTRFNGVCTFYKMYVAFCTFNIRYTNPWYTGLYIVRTRLYDWKRVHKCIYMYIHVWTMYIPVHTTTCTYHVHTMYIHVYTFTEMYIHICTCLCLSIIVYTMSVSRCTLALSIHCTYMIQTCLYTFMPGGQDSRWSGIRQWVPTCCMYRVHTCVYLYVPCYSMVLI